MIWLILILFLVLILASKIGGGAVEINKLFYPLYSRKLSFRTTPYFEHRPHAEMLCLKLGQRKLLFSELEYFNSFARDDICVVYAGAASGIHSTFLANIFRAGSFIFMTRTRFRKI